MNTEAAILQALHDDPADETSWLVLSDWLEEQGDLPRAELLGGAERQLRATPFKKRGRRALETRVQELLAGGVRPCLPARTNSLGMSFNLIPAGKSVIGSTEKEAGRSSDESPRHEVEITRPFYLGTFPVTQEEYLRLTGTNPSHFTQGGAGAEVVVGLDTRRFPVECVSWDDAQELCRQLSDLPAEQQAGRSYRLPTEAEWEYACRAATTTIFHVGNGLTSHDACFDGSHPYDAETGPDLERTVPVGSYPPNGFGLYDMHGNVWEWTADWYAEDAYRHGPHQGAQGPASGSLRVLRGGSWTDWAVDLRCAYRYNSTPEAVDRRFGLRLVLVRG